MQYISRQFVFLFALVLVPAAARPAFGQVEQQPDGGRFLRWAYQDVASLVQEPGAKLPIYALGSMVALAPATLLDRPIGHEVREEYTGGLARYLDVVNELGGPKVSIPVATVFAASLLTDDSKFQDAAFTSLQALAYTGAAQYALKTAFGRSRPYQGRGPFRFDPFSGNSSFVSGHTATAFAVLTPWAMYYPGPVTYGLLALGAGGTGVARIARDKHWATDVVAGAALGFITAYWLSERHQREMQAKPVSVDFLAAPGSVSLALRVQW